MKDDFLKFLRSLRAVREYTPEAVPQEALVVARTRALGAQTCGTASGQSEPRDTMDRVFTVPNVISMARLAGVPVFLWLVLGVQTAAADYWAVALLIVSASETSAFDEGRVAERIALAARACGLGSCIATLKNEGPDAAKQLLGIPAERRARTLVSIGHTDVEARRALPKAAQARKPMSEFAHWDRY